jgi:hypothetical protein
LGLVSCRTPQGGLVSNTDCTATTALATYGWEVAYFPERFRNEVNRHRMEVFAQAELLNRNGEKPAGEVIGPDNQGVWWPLLPSRPTADEVDDRRDDDFRYNNPPLLQRSVRYSLECEDGKFAVTDDQYRQVGRALQEGKTVQARYGLGQVLQIQIGESNETKSNETKSNEMIKASPVDEPGSGDESTEADSALLNPVEIEEQNKNGDRDGRSPLNRLGKKN